MEVEAPTDCDENPRKSLLRDFNVALASSEIETVLDHVSDEIRWKLVGSTEVDGKAAFEKALQGSNMKVARLLIENMVTEGAIAVVDGELELENGFRLSFCDIYRFESADPAAKIELITAYVISSA